MPAPMSNFILENYDLINCQISIFQWKHEYDVDGNPVNIDFGIGECRGGCIMIRVRAAARVMLSWVSGPGVA